MRILISTRLPLSSSQTVSCWRCTSQANRSCSRSYATTSTTPSAPRALKLAIIGSGPSAFYAASRILQLAPLDSPFGSKVEIHMYERLPTPYGLVRYGVAPDHPEVKTLQASRSDGVELTLQNCQHKFDELSLDPRFRYFGNTLISPQPSSNPSTHSPSTSISSYTYPHALRLSLSSILPYYTSVLLAYGASLSNPLSHVSGSGSSPHPLKGVYQALALVGWYNGHPAFADLPVDLGAISDVSVVGQGNVALDVARILLKNPRELDETDMPLEVLDVLHKSKVRSVTAVGRRGPAQVAFTTKELREMVNLDGVGFAGVTGPLMEEAKIAVEGDRVRKRMLGLMEKPSKAYGQDATKKEFKLDFLKGPKAFNPDKSDPTRIRSVEWEINTLLSPASAPMPSPPSPDSPSTPAPISGAVLAAPTGEVSTSKADMVVESVGYRSEGLAGEGWMLPFDDRKGRVRNVGGIVVSEEGVVIPGVYAAGWVARGPVGVIASTMTDAFSIAQQILEDHQSLSRLAPPGADPTSTSHSTSAGNAGREGERIHTPLQTEPESGIPDVVLRGLKEGKVVDVEGWRRIDEAEKDRAKGTNVGEGKQKERIKFRRVEEMLAVLS